MEIRKQLLLNKKQFEHRWKIESYYLVWKNLREVIKHLLRIVNHYVKRILTTEDRPFNLALSARFDRQGKKNHDNKKNVH